MPSFERSEIGTVLELVSSMAASSPPLVIELVGEPGSGRSRALSALAERLGGIGYRTFPAQAYPGRGSTRRTLADLAHELGEGLSEPSRAALDATVREALRRADRADVLFGEVALPGAMPGLVAALEEAFAARRVAFLLDDGQHAEPLLWRFLVRVLASSPAVPRVLLAATDGARDLPVRYPGKLESKRLGLEPLSEEDLGKVLAAQGVETVAAPAWARALHAGWLRTPRAACLLAEELLANPTLDPAAAGQLLSGGSRKLFERRLARLTEDERELCQLCSVSASGINFWRLERLPTTHRDEAASITAALERRGILRSTYPGGKLRLVFREAEERLIAYSSIPEDRRRLLHAQFARVVEEDDLDSEDRCSEAGRHLCLSGDELSGAAKLLEAGRHLLRRGRIDEARRHFQEVIRRARAIKALRLERLYAVEGTSDIEARTGTLEQAVKNYQSVLDEGSRLLSAEDRVRLYRKQARCRSAEGSLQEAERLLALAQEACTDEMPVERALLHDAHASLGVRRGDLAAAVGHSQKALAIALRVRDERLLATTHRTMASIRQARGDLHGSLHDLESARELFEKIGDAAGYAAVCNDKGNAYAALGQVQEAIALYESALRIQQGLSDLAGVTGALNNLATLHIAAGELDQAELSLLDCLRLQQRMGDLNRAAIAHVNLAAVSLSRNRYEEALTRAQDAFALSERLGNTPTKLAAQVARAAALMSLGRVGEALQTALETESAARAAGVTLVLVRALASAGAALAVVGDPDGAEGKLLQSLQLAQEHGYASEQREAFLQLSDLEMERGQLAQARKHLAKARAAGAGESSALLLQDVALKLREGEGTLPEKVRSDLEACRKGRSADVRARTARQTAEILPPDEALPHARESYQLFKEMGAREELWRSALRLGEIERALGLPEAAPHLDEAARAVLSIAAELSDEHRESYLKSYGRRRVLRYAQRLE